MVKLVSSLALILAFTLLPAKAFAHEAYVLTAKELQTGLATNTVDPLGSFGIFLSPTYLPVTLAVTMVFGLSYLINFLLAVSEFGKKADQWLRKYRNVGLLVVRLALAASFLYGASGGNVFGPELSLSHVAFGWWILPLKFILGIMFLFGIGTELAALLGIVVYVLVFASVGGYAFTYLNYLGELAALALFGSRFLSVDGWLFKKRLWLSSLEKFKRWEVPIVRVGLGLALVYTALNVKFLHQVLPVDVVNQYHLERYFFGWSPQYIAVGAGMVELMIGFFVLIGFAQRLTVLIFTTFITLSLLYFREAVWPHLMLYGISVLIFVDSADRLTVDHFLVPLIRGRIRNIVASFCGGLLDTQL